MTEGSHWMPSAFIIKQWTDGRCGWLGPILLVAPMLQYQLRGARTCLRSPAKPRKLSATAKPTTYGETDQAEEVSALTIVCTVRLCFCPLDDAARLRTGVGYVGLTNSRF